MNNNELRKENSTGENSNRADGRIIIDDVSIVFGEGLSAFFAVDRAPRCIGGTNRKAGDGRGLRQEQRRTRSFSKASRSVGLMARNRTDAISNDSVSAKCVNDTYK